MKNRKHYTMKDIVKIVGVCKNTIINWEKAGYIKVRRDPLFNYRVWNHEEVEQLKKLKNRGGE
jgi:predicted site-specific integrase-resolvase